MNKSQLRTIHELALNQVARVLETNIETGLSQEVYDARLEKYGNNRVTEETESNLLQDIIKQLLNPLALVLLLALGLTLFLHEFIDAGVIALATTINVIISLYQERRAGNAFKALNTKRVHNVTVVRAREQFVATADTLVVGDVVFVQAGDYVPADMRLIKDNRLSANQVAFTGETRAVEKNASASHEKNPFNRADMLFMGSTVVTGSGIAIVTFTGDNTQLGGIASGLSQIEKDLSPIQTGMQTIAKWLGLFTSLVLVVLVVIGVLRGFDFYTIVLLAVAVAVSAIPEGLLSAVTVVLAFGAREVMQRGGLVKNLASAETLGSATYILTDKTGTLTHGVMKVENDFTVDDADVAMLQETALGATDVFYDNKSHRFVGDEMDVALAKRHWKDNDSFIQFSTAHSVLDTIPFDSRYKFFASLRQIDGQNSVCIKGFPDGILQACKKIYDKGEIRDMTDTDRNSINRIISEQSGNGRRLLAIARRDKVGEDIFANAFDNTGHASLPEELVWCGLVSFYDRVRSSVPAVIDNIRQSGISVIMITGDGAQTAHQIALESGVITDPKEAVFVGDEIDEMTDEHLLEIMQTGVARIFARVTPEHKLRLATILQDAGEVVAMTGDGVNDAMALQKATIGISLSSSTEVAKEAADLVLLDDSFDTIAFAITEGRRMVGNLKKTVIYLLSTSFSEVLVLMGSLLIGGPVPFYPTQILWANIIEEGLMNFAFIFEPDHHEKHDRDDGPGIVNRHTRNMVIGVGILNGLILFGLYLGLIWWGIEGDLLRTYMFAALSVDSVFFGLALKSLFDPIWKLKLFSNVYLAVASAVSLLLLIAALEVPFLRTILHLEVLPWTGLLFVAGIGVLNLVMIEAVKKLCK